MKPVAHPEAGWYHAETIAVKTAKTLNEAGIPCILWGDCSISLWGTRVMKDTINFVVPDDMADKAIQALLNTQPYPKPICSCEHPADCADWDNGAENFPSKRHLHWSHMTDCVRTRFQIFARSELLSLPPMDALPSEFADTAAFVEAIGPHYLLASDTSHLPLSEPVFHTGAYEPGNHPVVTPMPHVVIETEMRLYTRHVQTSWTSRWTRNQCILGFDNHFVNAKLMLHPVLRDLFIRSRDETFTECTEYHRLLSAALGEKPYVVKWLTPRPAEQSQDEGNGVDGEGMG